MRLPRLYCNADYVDFLRRISLEDPRRLSPADAAHHALLISSFRDTLQSSSTVAAAGGGISTDSGFVVIKHIMH